jgi:ABC-2 type transport system permease protein
VIGTRLRGLGTMLGIQWRLQRVGMVAWVVALAGSMVATALAVAGLYDSPEKIHTYAQAAESGSALLAINGRVEGIASLGGVIQDEFGFLAAFVLPLMGISLVARSTRREEEAGRTETLLAGAIARRAPTLACLVLASAAIVLTAGAFAVGLRVAGVPTPGAVLYAASLGALAFVFAGITSLAAQFVLHSRSLYTWGLGALGVSYLVRGIGDVSRTPITWLSPLGWAEKAAPFGAGRWWTLLPPILAGAVAAAVAVNLAGRRDLGSALVRAGAGPARAAGPLRTPLGLAARIHGPAWLGWLAGAVLLAGTLGALAQQMLDAIGGNPAIADALGAAGNRPVDGFLAMTQLYLAVVATGYLVQAVGALRAEEAAGRLEPRLSGTLSRTAWLAAHAVVVGGGLITLQLLASSVLALTTAWSVTERMTPGRILASGLAYLPAELVVGALALALYGAVPRAMPLAWAAYAGTTFIALLGPGLKLPGWVRDLAPTTHVGNPPLEAIHGGTLASLSTLAVGLVAAAFVTFRRRAVPRG